MLRHELHCGGLRENIRGREYGWRRFAFVVIVFYKAAMAAAAVLYMAVKIFCPADSEILDFLIPSIVVLFILTIPNLC